MNQLSILTQKIKLRGFPELLSVNTPSRYACLKDSLLEVQLEEGDYLITVDNSLKNVSEEILTGGLAHELAHITMEDRSHPIMRRVDTLLHRISKRYRVFDERRTDKLVIKKGFGRELLQFMEYSEKKGYAYDKEDGFSIDELRRHLNSYHQA